MEFKLNLLEHVWKQSLESSQNVATGGQQNDLPKFSSYISGAKVYFMIGIKYLLYFPEQVFQMPSGLTIYRSRFENAGGGRSLVKFFPR